MNKDLKRILSEITEDEAKSIIDQYPTQNEFIKEVSETILSEENIVKISELFWNKCREIVKILRDENS